MRKFLSRLVGGGSLSYEEAREAIHFIATEKANPFQAAAFLMGIQQKGITAEELSGFREEMLSLAIDVSFDGVRAMDVCGTGGDGKNTFNISTTSAFIAAGAGVKIAKHGNHGVSSSVGSSTVLEYLGVKFTNDKNYLGRKIDSAGICYLHAPLFHPAMKAVAGIRKDLGIKTFFNILGPLLNPAKVSDQLTGVFDMKTFELYKSVFERKDGNYAVIHSLDGYDEISMTGDFRVWNSDGDRILNPEKLGLKAVSPDSLSGGDTLEESAKVLIRILRNEGTVAQTTAVLANAGLAIAVYKNIDLTEGLAQARESVESGRAYQSLKKLVE